MTNTDQQGQLYRWVKASERLPKKFGMYVCKVKIKKDGLTFHPASYVQFDTLTNDWTQPSVANILGEVLEWLEPLPPTEREGKMFSVEDMEKWLMVNTALEVEKIVDLKEYLTSK